MEQARGWLEALDPHQQGRRIGVTRIGIGVVFLLAPARATRRALRAGNPSPDAVTALRMVGGRDLALGLGAVLGARRRPEALRGWMEAGALSDGLDAVALLGDRGVAPAVRFPLALVAGTSAVAGMLLARRIG